MYALLSYISEGLEPLGKKFGQTVQGRREDASACSSGTFARLCSASNALLFQVLTTAADLASHVNATSLSSAWSANATALKQRFNEVFWLPSAGLYRDNDTTTLCPQDANSMAVLFNLTVTPEQVASVSEGLTKYWNDLGPVAPELPDTISPFISGLEHTIHATPTGRARKTHEVHDGDVATCTSIMSADPAPTHLRLR
ncbi:hypothetical protein VTO73DRAFT_14503 [Trametes versicolor]